MRGRHAIIADILRLVPPRDAETSHARANLDRLDDAVIVAMRDGLTRAAPEFGSEQRRGVAGTVGRGGGAGRAGLTGGFSKLAAVAGALREGDGIGPPASPEPRD
jgi:hypothetical protein